jgi:hypothetical protein
MQGQKISLTIEEGYKVGMLYLYIGNVGLSMQILHSRNFLPDSNQVDLDLCEHCVYGKHKRVTFLNVGKE